MPNLNANEWELLGPKSSMTEDQAYGFTFTDPDFWKQNDTPTPGVTAGWENYWETLSETVLTSSQTLGSVSLTEKIANANFDGFSGGNFSATGDVFYIGDGTGAVRIDYNVNDDTVADLIQRGKRFRRQRHHVLRPCRRQVGCSEQCGWSHRNHTARTTTGSRYHCPTGWCLGLLDGKSSHRKHTGIDGACDTHRRS